MLESGKPQGRVVSVTVEERHPEVRTLLTLGKERGYLTYAEINDHLPDDILDAEQIEGVISMIGDMGIQVFDQAPDADTLLMAESPAAAPTEDVEEEAEAAASTLDSEFGRTTDPVRMYMREMGSVELLTREGEIEIAKRIEDGLRHMIQAWNCRPARPTATSMSAWMGVNGGSCRRRRGAENWCWSRLWPAMVFMG